MSSRSKSNSSVNGIGANVCKEEKSVYIYTMHIENRKKTTLSPRQACFAIAHSSGDFIERIFKTILIYYFGQLLVLIFLVNFMYMWMKRYSCYWHLSKGKPKLFITFVIVSVLSSLELSRSSLSTSENLARPFLPCIFSYVCLDFCLFLFSPSELFRQKAGIRSKLGLSSAITKAVTWSLFYVFTDGFGNSNDQSERA